MIEKRLTELVHSIAAALAPERRCTTSVYWPRSIIIAKDVRRRRRRNAIGRDNVVRNLDPSMGAEDFVHAEAAPRFAAGSGRCRRRLLSHNSTYDFNDAILKPASAATAEAAMPLHP
jgi:hippurate hydrolase